MAEQKIPSSNQEEVLQQLLDSIAELKPRQRTFLQHYLNPHSPGYGNATKSAELTAYAGEPGSVQLSVQGHRLLHHPKTQRCMAAVFEQAGCTLELDAKVMFEALTATQTQYLRGPHNTIVSTPPQPDHPTRLRAVEIRHRLLRTQPATATHQHLPAVEVEATESADNELCRNCGEAMSRVATFDPADRGILRAITECDQELANSETRPQEDAQEDEDAKEPE